MEVWKPEQYQKFFSRAKGVGKPKQSANDLTKSLVQYLNTIGFKVWRNNTMGVFDSEKTADKLFDYIGLTKWSSVNLRGIKACFVFRKSHELKGASDILGMTPNGRFLAIEVKVGKDKLSPEQEWFLDDVKRKGGIGIVARTWDQCIEELEKVMT